jgi:uncharacterized protein (TIGR03067 family)
VRRGSPLWIGRLGLIEPKRRPTPHSKGFHPWLVCPFSKETLNVNRRILIVLAVALSVGADTQKDDKVKDESNKLQGAWSVTAAERDGMKAPDDEIKKITITIKGDKLIARRTENAGKPEEKIYDMSFTIDPTQKPKWMDVTYTDGERKGESSQGIYELESDGTLKICMSRGNTRPNDFETKPESQRHLMVLKRTK